MLNDTIVAISTPLEEGAISIIRLSGNDAIEIVNKIFNKDLLNKKSHTITYGMIIDENNNELDEVLVSIFKGPKSYTCEDVVEINCHGGIYITKTILSLCISHNARLAKPGEFTQRAFLNGRIDLVQAEGVNDLINASNRIEIKNALSSLKGNVTKLIEGLIDDLVQIIANIEVNIDYPEYEDVEVMTNSTILPLSKKWKKDLTAIIDKAKSSLEIKDGINTVILGKPNVGKSSLLNALLQEEKAIVTDVAGTTRDLVEGKIRLSNISLNLIDTAGIRETDDLVEKIGITKSLEALNKAQLVILVLDANKPLDDEDYKLLDMTQDYNRIIVYNKDDNNKFDGLGISALNNKIDKLIDEIELRFKKQISAYNDLTLNNQRQVGLAISAKNHMANAIKQLEDGIELDLVTIDLQAAYNDLMSILGKHSHEDLLDEMFKRFCLGK